LLLALSLRKDTASQVVAGVSKGQVVAGRSAHQALVEQRHAQRGEAVSRRGRGEPR
jgi:hypothetical protein